MLFNNVSQFAVLVLLLFVGWLFGFASHPGGKRWKRAYQDEAVGRAQDRDELDTQLRDADKRIAELTAELEQARAPQPAPVVPAAPEAPPVAAAAETPPVVAASAPPPVVAPEPVYTPPPAPMLTPEPVYAPPPAPVTSSESVYAPPPAPVMAPTPDPVPVQPEQPVAPAQWSPAPQPEPATQPITAATYLHTPQPPAQPAPTPVEPARPVEEAQWTPAPAPEPQPEPIAQPAPEPVAEAEPLPIKRGWFDWSRGDDLTRLRGVDAELGARLKAEKVDSFAELAGLSDEEEIALERRLDLPAGYLMKEQLREQARMLADGDSDGHAGRFG